MKNKAIIAAIRSIAILMVIFYAVFYLLFSFSSGLFGNKLIIIVSLVMSFMSAFVVFNLYCYFVKYKNWSNKL